MASDAALRAIRNGVAWIALDSHAFLQMPGKTARAALNRICPLEIFLREGQALQTLFLHDDARPFADLFVVQTSEGITLLAEGPAPAELAQWITAATSHPVEVRNETTRLYALTGPYAWELLGVLVGTDAHALPTLHHHRFGSLGCLRAGKTGEYCYLITVPAAEASAFEARLLAAGAAFDLERADDAALAQCALETWNFNIHREGRAADVTPIELQLQWRVSYSRDYPGSAALQQRQREGATRRLTMVLGSNPFSPGDAVHCDGNSIGVVVNAGFCAPRNAWAGMALLDRAYAVSGMNSYQVLHAGAEAPLRTVSPPVICQRSLFVIPGQHSYRRRSEYNFPEP